MEIDNLEAVLRIMPEANSYAYRKLLHIDLNHDRCDILKSDAEGWQPVDGPLSAQLADFAAGGAVHPEDAGRLAGFVQPERLRAALAEQSPAALAYRRRTEQGYRWNLMEIIPDYPGGALPSATLCVKDVHDRLRRELERSKRDMQMAAILKCRYQMMTTVDLESGQCERIDLTGLPEPEAALTGDYETYIQNALDHFVHPDDAADFRSLLSLEHLRETAAATQDHNEEILSYRLRGERLRWIKLHIFYSRQPDRVMVNILGHDVTKEKQEEAHNLKALEDRSYMITSLSKLFFSTYYIDLEKELLRAVTQLRRVEDILGNEINCTAAMELYANHFIYPDDRAAYLAAMDMKNLRQSLRWWKPYVSVEYRKLPDSGEMDESSCTWVRATAVLARTGKDDMPSTAVYVARDITDEKHGPDHGSDGEF